MVHTISVFVQFSLFEPFFLHGLFFEKSAGIAAHATVRVAAVQYVLLMITMRLSNVLPFTVLMHVVVFGDSNLLVDGILI